MFSLDIDPERQELVIRVPISFLDSQKVDYRKMIRTQAHGRLTNRQLAILDLVVRGFDNKDIARTMGVAVTTVKWHVCGLLKKYGVKTRYKLEEAVRAGAVPKLTTAIHSKAINIESRKAG